MSSFKYLGVTLSSKGSSKDDINNKVGQGKQTIKQLNSILWNNNITSRTKHIIFHSIVESIMTYDAELWEFTQRQRERLLVVEIDFWRRSSGFSRLDYVRND